MKMISSPSAEPVQNFSNYAHDCQRGKCDILYHVPVPGVPYVQLYVDFGSNQPLAIEFTLLDFCNQSNSEQVFPSNFIAGQTPEGGWYGVFKFFNTPSFPVTSFVLHLSAIVTSTSGPVQRTWFSEIYIAEPCAPLGKIKSCHPETATVTGFDINDIFYGLPEGDYLGIEGVRYFHIVYARLAKMRELPPTATFTSNLIRNFRTQVDQKYTIETELVPKWYKDYFLGVYSRGAISFNDGPAYLVDSLAFEAVNDDDLIWKPYANLKKTTKLYYGCDGSNCSECCTPQIISANAYTSGSPGDSDSDLPPDSESDSVPESESDVPEDFGENFRFSYNSAPDDTAELVFATNSAEPIELVYIDWGDGTQDEVDIQDAIASHVYAEPGIYLIKVRFNDPSNITIIESEAQQGILSVEYVQGSFNNLERISIVDGGALETVDLEGMPDGITDMILEFYGNNLTAFDFTTIPTTVTEINISSNNITTLAGDECPASNLNVATNPLTSITGPTLPLSNLTCLGCTLPEAEVNSILVKLDANGQTDGAVDLSVQTPAAPPSGAGATAKSNLLAKTWAVITD